MEMELDMGNKYDTMVIPVCNQHQCLLVEHDMISKRLILMRNPVCHEQAFAYSSEAAPLENIQQLWQEGLRPPLLEVPCPSLPTESTFYVSILQRIVQHQALSDGKHAHFYIVSVGLDQDLTLNNLLLYMYGYCGALQDAWALFSGMPHRDTASWSSLTRSYSSHGDLDNALHILYRMQGEGLVPEDSVICSLISACSRRHGQSTLRLIHAFVIERSLNPSVFVSTALLSMYGKSACLMDAKAVFNDIKERDVVCWNAMIASYVSEEENVNAMRLFYKMNVEGVKPEKCTFLSILSACASHKGLVEGRLIHNSIFDGGFESDVGIANSLVNMYGVCDSLQDAQKVFDHLSGINVVSWNVMIAGLVHNGRAKEGISLFERMQWKGVAPSHVTFISLLSACSSPADLEEGHLFHHFVICNGMEVDLVMGNSLVSMYGKCGAMRDARIMFENSRVRDRVSWTAILTVCGQGGQEHDIVPLFEQMQVEGVVPDRVTFVSVSAAIISKPMLHKCKQMHASILSSKLGTDLNLENSLVTMYGKCGDADYAKKVFEKMPKRDILSWNAIISAYVQNELSEQALEMLNAMGQEGILPDEFLCASIVTACASTGALDKGKQMHTLVVMDGYEENLSVGNAVINMYGKLGNLEDARWVFDRMQRRDIVSWSAIIGAFAQQGQGKLAVTLYNKMLQEGVAPDKIALVHLLSACSHDGLVDEGLRHFFTLAHEHNEELITEHVNCMVDMLGRAGRLEEAEKLLLEFPLKASTVAWITVLGACRNKVDVKRGEFAASRVFNLDPEHAAAYITLSNLYFAAGRTADALEVVKKMRERGLVNSMPIDVLTGLHDSCGHEEAWTLLESRDV